MKPASYRVIFRLVRPGSSLDDQPVMSRTIDHVGFDSYYTEDATFEISNEGGRLQITVEPRVSIVIDSLIVFFDHEFEKGDKVLLNGYQTWTDTDELPIDARMKGLRGVLPPIVDKFVLDGGGDYRFVSYDGKPGHLHGFTYATFRREDSEEITLLGSLDESQGFTFIRTETENDLITAETECPRRILLPGDRVTLCGYALVSGTVDEAYDKWFSLMGVKARPAKPLVGYTSWYRHYGNIDEGKLVEDIDGEVEALDWFDCGGAIKLSQIDDGYCKVGDWLDVDGKKFPFGLEPIAKKITQSKMVPGLWLAPFVAERDSKLHEMHPDWMLLDEAGNEATTGSQWSGGLALDTLNPDVRNYVREVIETATRQWGFRMLKLDFLYAACMIPHGGKNRGQLMADAVDLLRDAAGEDCMLLGCGVPLGSAFGKFEYCRIGCDVGLDWDDKLFMRGMHRERVSTKNSIMDTKARSPLDGRAFANDPDVVFLRDDVRLSQSQKDLMLETASQYASMLLTSDDMGEWDGEQRARFQNALDRLLERKTQ